MDRFRETIIRRSRRRIEIFSDAGDDWRFAESLKSVSEDTAQEYEGRALFELVQNGYDALDAEERGRMLVLLDLEPGPHGTIYVANEGAPFTDSNFEAITELGLSNKGAGEGIGNKGLGFRSVLQLTDWPEVYSKAHRRSAAFDGYCFRFATPDDVLALVGDEALARDVTDKVSALALPVPANELDDRLAALASAGYSTVVRLPLRNDRAAEAARQQLESLLSPDGPVLLFLDRLVDVDLSLKDGTASWERRLEREQRAFTPLRDSVWCKEVDLGPQGRFLVASRLIEPGALRGAIEASIEAREIDEKWQQWSGDARVAIALRLDEPLAAGRLYTFLPMSSEATSPICCHVHAPFFTKLARGQISVTITFNAFLLDQVACLARDLIIELDGRPPDVVPAGLMLDAACWEPPERLQSAFEAIGRDLADEPFVPIVGRRQRDSLRATFTWPYPGARVMTAPALARLGVGIVDPGVPDHRRNRLTRLHESVFGSGMDPAPSRIAEWVEQVAGRLTARARVPMERWADFYDDLAAIFSGNPGELSGRKVVLDQQGHVIPALGGATPDGRRSRTVFFAPDDSADETSSRVPRDLRALQRRMAFTHPDIPWTIPGNPQRRRPGRTFLEPQLVREYRSDRVLDALRELLEQQQSDAFRRDALFFAFRQHASLNDAQRVQLRTCGFYVPLANGRWRRADQALFHPSWHTEGGRRLRRFLDAGGDTIEECAALRERWTGPAGDWPADGATADWESFLRAIGVRDGLLLLPLRARTSDVNGDLLRPERLASMSDIDSDLASSWPALVRQRWSDFAHPWTKYAFDRPLVHLPGAAAVASLGTLARREFAELVLLGLAEWPQSNFEVRVRRPTRPWAAQDPHDWPTPLAAQIRSLRWLPVVDESAPEGIAFVRPDEAWFASDGELPSFVPAIPTSARKLVGDDAALRRLTGAGLRTWEDPANGPELVRSLGELLDRGAVPTHMTAQFKKHYVRGWTETARARRWPWTGNAHEDVRLAAMEASTLVALGTGGPERLFIPDEDDAVKDALLELVGFPVLVSAAADGALIRRMFDDNQVAVRAFSETEVLVEADTLLVQPSGDLPFLTEGSPWLPELVGLVIELKSGEVRRSERLVREKLRLLRSCRIVRSDAVEVLIEGARTELPPSSQSVPMDDDSFPTVVVADCASGWSELRAASTGVCHLLGVPTLQPALELALVKLQARVGDALPLGLTDDDLVHALDTPAHRLIELRHGLASEIHEAVDRLRPALICLLGADRIDDITGALTHAADWKAVESTIEAWEPDLGSPAQVLLEMAKQVSTDDELRVALGLPFATYNEALQLLGPPYRPVTHVREHEMAFRAFVEAHNGAIDDRLREHYAPRAARVEDLTGYVEGRRREGLSPDPAWLLRYETPPDDIMRVAVERWLGSHGSDPDLAAPGTLPPLAELRASNAATIERIVLALQRRVVAWCRKHGRSTPLAWTSTPVMTVRDHFDSRGLADLLTLTDDDVSSVAAELLTWPEDMPRTADLGDLGLTEEDLAAGEGNDASGSRPTPRRPTISVGDATFDAGVDRFVEIAAAVYGTVDEALLEQDGSVSLREVASARSGSRRGARHRTVVARSPGMPEEERRAIGLVGEVVAKAWLSRRYDGVRWRSGYAAIVNDDDEASDSHGYDFEVSRGNTSLLFEVKAFTDELRDIAEFEMGESEVRAAQECARGDRYRLLLVTSVLEPATRQIHNLPSPFSRKGAGRFRIVGRGLRYRVGAVASL